ncbi:hypothetical protein [Massilia sp. DD77]
MLNQNALWTFIKISLVLTAACHLFLASYGIGDKLGAFLYRLSAG